MLAAGKSHGKQLGAFSSRTYYNEEESANTAGPQRKWKEFLGDTQDCTEFHATQKFTELNKNCSQVKTHLQTHSRKQQVAHKPFISIFLT